MVDTKHLQADSNIINLISLQLTHTHTNTRTYSIHHIVNVGAKHIPNSVCKALVLREIVNESEHGRDRERDQFDIHFTGDCHPTQHYIEVMEAKNGFFGGIICNLSVLTHIHAIHGMKSFMFDD